MHGPKTRSLIDELGIDLQPATTTSIGIEEVLPACYCLASQQCLKTRLSSPGWKRPTRLSASLSGARPTIPSSPGTRVGLTPKRWQSFALLWQNLEDIVSSYFFGGSYLKWEGFEV